MAKKVEKTDEEVSVRTKKRTRLLGGANEFRRHRICPTRLRFAVILLPKIITRMSIIATIRFRRTTRTWITQRTMITAMLATLMPEIVTARLRRAAETWKGEMVRRQAEMRIW